jgi:hypothetical protein
VGARNGGRGIPGAPLDVNAGCAPRLSGGNTLVAPGSGTVDKEDRMQEEVGKASPRLEERKGASEYFLAFALLHAGCGDEVIEARLNKRTLACWCSRCDELRIISDPVGRDNGNLKVPARDPATSELGEGEPYEVGLR